MSLGLYILSCILKVRFIPFRLHLRKNPLLVSLIPLEHICSNNLLILWYTQLVIVPVILVDGGDLPNFLHANNLGVFNYIVSHFLVQPGPGLLFLCEKILEGGMKLY